MNCPKTSVYAFADDLKLLGTDANDLQCALNLIDDWTTSWKLLLNTDKSEHLTIQQKIPMTFTLKNQIIPKIKSVRDLGITLSDNLKWGSYISKVRSKASSLSHIILRTFSSNNASLIVNLYKTYVRPIMEYNTPTWSPHLKCDIREAESVQQKFTKSLFQRLNITFADYSDRLSKLNLESLESRRIKNDLILTYKLINNIVDIDCSKHFKFSRFGGHNLRRHSLHLTHQQLPLHLSRQNFYSNRVINHWNSLPSHIVQSPTLDIFKHQLNIFYSDK